MTTAVAFLNQEKPLHCRCLFPKLGFCADFLYLLEEQRCCDGQGNGTRRSFSVSLTRWVAAAHGCVAWPIPTNYKKFNYIRVQMGFQKVCPCRTKMAATSHGKAWTSAVYSPAEAGCPPPPCFLPGVPVTVKVQVGGDLP